jgi:isohexenylglutaconyl-CoA hydratase
MKYFPKTENLILEYTDGWLDIWFNRIENRNAITGGLIDDLFSVFSSVHNNREVRGITLRGKGGIFCAGADLKGIKKISEAGSISKDLALEMSVTFGKLFKVINQAPQIIVAVTEGSTLAGGFGIACASDLIVTMPDTKFALTETRLGLTPAQISPYVINRLGYALARKMMLLGANINGEEAMAIGIADYLACDADKLEEIISDIKSKVFKCAPNAIAMTKQILTINEYIDPEKAADLFSDCIVSDEGKDGFNSFFEKRKPYWVPNKKIK